MFLAWCEAHQAFRVLQATDDMLMLFPDGAPDGNIIEATVENPTHGHAFFERSDGRTDGGECLLDFARFADKAGSLAAEEAVIEDATMLGSETNDVEGAIAIDQTAL